MPSRQNIPETITADDVRNGIDRFIAGEPHGFADSTAYDLLHEGRRFPPKAILGLSTFRLLGKPLQPADFSGGEDSKCFRILRKLGFSIVPKAVGAWLEMSRDEAHGGTGWGFSECLWSPARKKDGARWPFWSNLRLVQKGETIVHLKGDDHDAAFVGCSIAAENGEETESRPPNPKEWAFASTFYRVPLRDYVRFSEPLNLRTIFRMRDAEFREYFFRNKAQQPGLRRSLFFVVQSGQLQCLNGAYLSNFDAELATLCLGTIPLSGDESPRFQVQEVPTSEQLRLVQVRVGQSQFSENVRANFDYACCFPGCEVSDARFLVGAHIARWADAEVLRGKTENGLCFCLMHDKAFEQGLFTLDLANQVRLRADLISTSIWARKFLAKAEGARIKPSRTLPSAQALALHWRRIGFRPDLEGLAKDNAIINPA